MDKKQLQLILEDLYVLDGSLRDGEDQLKKLITDLYESRPPLEQTGDFEGRLRIRLMEKISQMKATQKQTELSINNFNPMQKMTYVVGGVLVCAMLVLGGVYAANKNGWLVGLPEISFGDSQGKTRLASRAFGPLSGGNPAGSASGQEAYGLGAGGDSAMMSVDIDGRGGGGAPTEARMISPEFKTFRYVYEGEGFEQNEASLAVLKRVKNGGGAFSSLLSGLNFDFVDLKAFAGTRLDNLTFSQDRDFGYSIFVSLKEEMVSISKNWQRWEKFDRNRTTPSNIPDDQTIISLAEEFIQSHGIKIEGYGQPQVSEQWYVILREARKSAESVLPQEMQVTYPLLVDGQKVYEGGGYLHGLTVGIDLVHNKVGGVWNLSSNNHVSSVYEAETDTRKITDFAERGGMYGGYYYADQPNGAQVVDVKIGEPQKAYLKYWRYDQNSGESEEFLVPSLVFPVLEEIEGNYRSNIIVPLTKDILQEQKDQGIY